MSSNPIASWRGKPRRRVPSKSFHLLWFLPREDWAWVESDPNGSRPSSRKGGPTEAEEQLAGWCRQLLWAELSVIRNKLCSTGIEQKDYLNVFKPSRPQLFLHLSQLIRCFLDLTDGGHILKVSKHCFIKIWLFSQLIHAAKTSV